MTTIPASRLPPELPIASGLDDLLDHPGQWMLLARRGRSRGAEQLPPWEYPGIPFDGLMSEHRRLLDAAEQNLVFLPQRSVEEGWEWLGVGLPEGAAHRARSKPARRRFGEG